MNEVTKFLRRPRHSKSPFGRMYDTGITNLASACKKCGTPYMGLYELCEKCRKDYIEAREKSKGNHKKRNRGISEDEDRTKLQEDVRT